MCNQRIKSIEIPDDVENPIDFSEIDRLGAEGWELVSADQKVGLFSFNRKQTYVHILWLAKID